MTSSRNIFRLLPVLLLFPLLHACIEKNVYDEEHYSVTEPELDPVYNSEEHSLPELDPTFDMSGSYMGHDYVDSGIPSGLLSVCPV